MDFRKRIIQELKLSELQAETLLNDYVVVCEKLAKEYHTEQLNIGGVTLSKPKNRSVLNKAVSAIYFNDSSDYLKALYSITNELTSEEDPIDINRLFKSLNPE